MNWWTAADTVALCGVVVIAAVTAAFLILAERPEHPGRPRGGRHALGTAIPGPAHELDPARVLLYALHHEPVWTATLATAGPGVLPILAPDPPPDETRPQPAVWTAWGGRTVEEMVEEIFARACAQVTS